MLFKPELCKLILHGLKTQTRRLVQPSDHPFRDPDSGAILWVTRLSKRGWRLLYGTAASRGMDYAVCPGRGKPQVGRIRIIQIRQERLQEISDDDVRAEGFELRVDLGTDRSGRDVVMVGAHREELMETWDSLNRRPGERWADNPLVWALTFEVVK